MSTLTSSISTTSDSTFSQDPSVIHSHPDPANSMQQQQQQQQHQPIPSPASTPPPPQPKYQLSDFRRVRTLGTGTFARVCLVRPVNDPEKVYALKILRKTEVIKLKQISHVQHERQILESVTSTHHPFITNLVGSFSDASCLYLLLEYVPGGELFSYLRKYRRFDEPSARFYVAEIVLVLEHLHEGQGGVAYRDLKPENLLLDREGHVKLVDFGFAKRLGREGAGEEGPRETYTLCGTPEYLAPEVIQNKGHTTAVDWWALGILLYEFITGYPPFWHQNPLEIYKQIVEKPVAFPPNVAMSDEARDLIRSLCTVDRSKRLGNISGGARRVKEHAFFRGLDWNRVYERRANGPILPNVRFVGDAGCFDIYPEEDVNVQTYTYEMKMKYDHLFEGF
ncbi:putative camp-dependent protein kinase catalytic subunit protein [Zalerion maritima]|uniref:cAMP-dependent protein kinase n=1 Tax=Zalerion maritima TaxID=339359 RepID=A0AAD5RIM2_9PEZI|nr:putative camp-dependent protein kinase catalytic subunit protein [Zalerion maritima]